MSNLSITTRCNRRCPYCFASDSRDQKADHGDMSKQVFLAALSYLRRSNIDQVRLLGGEPTLHKNFIWMIDQSISQRFRLMIFSNGLIHKPVLAKLSRIPKGQIMILLNTIHPLENNPAGMKHQQATMDSMGQALMVGVNIYQRGMDLSYLFEYVKKYNLFPEIRVGIAHPLLSGKNLFLLPKFYGDVGRQIADGFMDAKKDGIRIGLDCGFVPCMFPLDKDETLTPLIEKSGVCCSPNQDILPDGNVIACYPLNNLNQYPLTPEADARMLIRRFTDDHAIYTDMGIFPYCSECPLFRSRCNGGCLAQKIKRLRITRTDQ